MATNAFDYIIVGAGSAGLYAGSATCRADPDVRVLLLEAGGWDRHPFVKHAARLGQRSCSTACYDWGYDSEPEESDRQTGTSNARAAK